MSEPQANKKFYRNGTAIILAETLPQLATSFEWFTTTDSGVSSSQKILNGLRFGTNTSPVEYLGDKDIITTLHTQSNGEGQAKTRLEIAQLSSGYNAKKPHQELLRQQTGVIIDRKHPDLAARDVQLPPDGNYAVMGLFALTDYWYDYEWPEDGSNEPVKMLVARMEKVTDDGIWWARSSDMKLAGEEEEQISDATDASTTASPHSHQEFSSCQTCGMVMKPRYEQGLFCGHPECPDSNNPDVYENTLGTGKRTYLQEYLDQRTDLSNSVFKPRYLPAVPFQLSKDNFIQLASQKKKGGATERHMWKAYLCKHCYRLNSRMDWNYLKCRHCGDEQDIRIPDLAFEELGIDGKWLNIESADDLPDLSDCIKQGSGITRMDFPPTHPDYVFAGWNLDKDCKILFGFPKKDTIYRKGGLKDLFNSVNAEIRSKSFSFKRPYMKEKQGMITPWYGHNWGVKYDTRMTVETEEMDTCPAGIRSMLDDWVLPVVQDALNGDKNALDVDFNPNERLMIGMYPNMHMGWHDDGEEQVQGDVASLSLGSTGSMRFGLKAKYYIGKFGAGRKAYDVDIIGGTLKQTEKEALKQQLDDGVITEDEWLVQYKAIVDDVKKPRDPKVLLEFPLTFGGIMVQYGKDLHKIYEHSTSNDGLMRYVCTGSSLLTMEEVVERKEAAAGGKGKKRRGESSSAGVKKSRKV